MTLKRCVGCGIEKPLTKYHAHPEEPDGVTPRCKVCHNGTTAWNERRRMMMRDRQPGDPSETQIEAACAAIRARWSARKFEARKNRKVPT